MCSCISFLNKINFSKRPPSHDLNDLKGVQWHTISTMKWWIIIILINKWNSLWIIHSISMFRSLSYYRLIIIIIAWIIAFFTIIYCLCKAFSGAVLCTSLLSILAQAFAWAGLLAAVLWGFCARFVGVAEVFYVAVFVAEADALALCSHY